MSWGLANLMDTDAVQFLRNAAKALLPTEGDKTTGILFAKENI